MHAPSFGIAGHAPSRQQVAGVYRTKVGEAEVTALLDGYIDVTPELWVNVSPDEFEAGLREDFLPPDQPLRISVNAYLVNVGGRLIAVDTGADTWFGPTAGRYLANLAAAGVRPEDVDTVLLTHMHPDHIGGLIAGGRTVFPKAEIVASAADHQYWTSDAEKGRAPDFAKTWFDAVRTVTQLYGERLKLFNGEAEVLPGFQAVALPGHTPGHTGFVLSSGRESLFFWADVTDSTTLQLNSPERALVFDIDKETGVRSRRRAIDLAAADGLLIAGSHVPFPSFGHVAKSGGRFEYVPATWCFDL